MRKNILRFAAVMVIATTTCQTLSAQKPATVKELKRVFTTYGYSDPNPIADMGKVYPYYRFDGYTNTPAKKEWKVVELENDFIKVMILPEIGGKIWAAWEKASGRPFIYYNQVVKFRDVAMRGPWTSGGIEANYGIIGHTPNCATPMDYMTKSNEDGSVSCFIGTLDLLTQTYWTIEINLPSDRAYFTTRSYWNNTTPLEQPYYTWMNVGMPAAGNLQFVYPGNRHIGHSGEYADWNINPENGKDISYYENNNFGGPKSYHVIGKYSEFFGAYYHDHNFGMARYSLRDEKPGRKIWIWGLSRNGMIWEKLLTDDDGQYVEVQSGRLFNQASDGSNFTPFKQLGFAPHTTDTWTEYWYPVKGTGGFVMANEFGALNLRTSRTSLRIDLSPVQQLNDELKILEGDKVIYSKAVELTPLTNFSDSVAFSGNLDNIVVTLGDTKLRYHADPKHDILSRPVTPPDNFDWKSAYGLYTLGKEFLQQRYYPAAEEKLQAALELDPNYLPALTELAMIAIRNLDYKKALAYTTHALSIDTYDPAANFYYGLANEKLGNVVDARDGFDIATLTPSHRGAAYTELSKLYLSEGDLTKSGHYATRSLESNSGNSAAWQILAVVARLKNDKPSAALALNKLEELNPLNHFIRFERYRWQDTEPNRNLFVGTIKNELPHETYLELADFYTSLHRTQDAADVLGLAPENPEVLYRLAYLKNQLKKGSGHDLIERANRMSPSLVFPFRSSSAEALEWVTTETNDWKPRYFLGLIYWNRLHTDRAKELFTSAGTPDYAPFYAAKAELFNDDNYAADLKRAIQLDPKQWRYGKMLADHLIARNDYAEALKVASEQYKRFNPDFRISMLYAKTLLLNKQYKATTDLLEKTTILPYEGATDGRQLYREAWLMQAIQQLKSKNHKAALASVNKAKLWPENLGAGKPYENMIDLRLENYLEALAHERASDKEKARSLYKAIVESPTRRRHQINDLVTALAYRKLDRSAEGEKILKEWIDQDPKSKIAQWAFDAYNGNATETKLEGGDNYRVMFELLD